MFMSIWPRNTVQEASLGVRAREGQAEEPPAAVLSIPLPHFFLHSVKWPLLCEMEAVCCMCYLTQYKHSCDECSQRLRSLSGLTELHRLLGTGFLIPQGCVKLFVLGVFLQMLYGFLCEEICASEYYLLAQNCKEKKFLFVCAQSTIGVDYVHPCPHKDVHPNRKGELRSLLDHNCCLLDHSPQ